MSQEMFNAEFTPKAKPNFAFLTYADFIVKYSTVKQSKYNRVGPRSDKPTGKCLLPE